MLDNKFERIMKVKFERIRYNDLRIDEFALAVIYIIDICKKI
jgi:hypothetical protein